MKNTIILLALTFVSCQGPAKPDVATFTLRNYSGKQWEVSRGVFVIRDSNDFIVWSIPLCEDVPNGDVFTIDIDRKVLNLKDTFYRVTVFDNYSNIVSNNTVQFNTLPNGGCSLNYDCR